MKLKRASAQKSGIQEKIGKTETQSRELQRSLTTDRSGRNAWTSFLLIITKKKITMKLNTKSRVTRLDMKIVNKKQLIWHIRRETGLGDVALRSLELEKLF